MRIRIRRFLNKGWIESHWKSRFAVIFILISGISSPRLTSATTIVVPGAYTAAGGNSSLTWVHQGSPVRIQTVIGHSELVALPDGSLITGLSLRRNAGFRGSEPWPVYPITYASYQIALSTSLHPPNSLSLVFDENIGADEVPVFSAALTIPPFAFPIGANPNAFGPTITFSTPFVYHSGDLLIEIVHSGSGDPGFDMQFDAVDRPDTLQTIVQSPGSPINPGPAVTGFDFDVAPVFQLTYTAVPEPASGILLGMGVGVLATRARRGRM